MIKGFVLQISRLLKLNGKNRMNLLRDTGRLNFMQQKKGCLYVKDILR